jgi:YidC/Oxa1 family membrane protein insertase
MILNWLNDYVHNYGFAIIILTALMRLLLLPFSLRAKRGMKDRVESQRQLQYIQQKYKDDPQAKAKAQAEYMRKHGLGLTGCLPLLIQLPVFLGLSKVLSSSIELYQAPFLWIKDLSAADPYYILPVAVTLGILYRAFTSKDNAQRMPLFAMAVVFGAFSATLPAGLVLYIAVGSVLNVA